MNRPPSPSCVPTRQRSRRGFTLLLAMGLIAMTTVAVLVALRAVTTESNLQAHERRAREAFFAAEAGMAEARVIVQSILGDSQKYNGVFTELGNQFATGQGLNGFVTEYGLPSDGNKPWYQVIPWTDYRMTRGTVGAGIDPGVTAANQELIGPDGQPIADYPAPSNVRYRVFIVDDDDAPPLPGVPPRMDDSNNHVWIVSVGEVSTNGGQPYRTIVRSLVTNVNGVGGGGGYGTKLGNGSNGSVYTGTMPTWTP